MATVSGDIGTGDRHAVVFQNGSVTDLTPNLAAPQESFANWINKSGQIVGGSAGRAFVWQNDVMTDLNTLVQAGYGDVLTTAQDINDLGEITGRAFDPISGARPAFLAVPSPGQGGR